MLSRRRAAASALCTAVRVAYLHALRDYEDDNEIDERNQSRSWKFALISHYSQLVGAAVSIVYILLYWLYVYEVVHRRALYDTTCTLLTDCIIRGTIVCIPGIYLVCKYGYYLLIAWSALTAKLWFWVPYSC